MITGWYCLGFLGITIGFYLVLYYILVAAGLMNDQMVTPSNSYPNYDPQFSYPLRFDSNNFCYPQTLVQCNVSISSSLSDPCCQSLWDKNSSPHETITTPVLILITIIVPCVIILFRHWILYKQFFTSHSKRESSGLGSVSPRVGSCPLMAIDVESREEQIGSENTCAHDNSVEVETSNCRWKDIDQRLFDQILGFSSSLSFQAIICLYLKSVGAPRPIYNALQVYSSVHQGIRSSFKSTSYHSFPSGHSATSCAGMMFLVLIFMFDGLRYWRQKKISLSLLCFQCVIIFIGVFLFVGASRIFDYWHFQYDVIGGWMIGLGCSMISYKIFVHKG